MPSSSLWSKLVSRVVKGGMEDVESKFDERSISTTAFMDEPFKDKLNANTGVYFVFTGPCQNQQSLTPCDESHLPELIFGEKDYSVTPDTPVGNPGSIGIRIIDAAVQGKVNRRKYIPVSAYVYCAPCVCLIQTGLAICRETPLSSLEFMLRPDPRLKASCHHKPSRLDGLRTLIDLCKEEEIRPNSSLNSERRKDLSYIDRVWIERAISDLNDDERDPLAVIRNILEGHLANETCYGIVILGEVEYSMQMMNIPPFPQEAKMPKETEIYQIKKTQLTILDKPSPWARNFLGTYTAKDFKAGSQKGQLAVVKDKDLIG